MTQTFFRDAVRGDGETEITVEIAVNNWGCSAHMGSMTYAGHPAEGLECEIVGAWLKADEDMPDAPRIELTDQERERIEIAFCEDPPEPDDGPEYEDN